MNILERANDIVFSRGEEKTRQYGDFIESMETATTIFNSMSNNQISTEDMYMAMIALKLSRQKHAHKEDNILDAIAYLASMNEYLNKKESDSAINKLLQAIKNNN